MSEQHEDHPLTEQSPSVDGATQVAEQKDPESPAPLSRSRSKSPEKSRAPLFFAPLRAGSDIATSVVEQPQPLQPQDYPPLPSQTLVPEPRIGPDGQPILSVYVSGFAPHISDIEISNLFAPCGPVTQVKVWHHHSMLFSPPHFPPI